MSARNLSRSLAEALPPSFVKTVRGAHPCQARCNEHSPSLHRRPIHRCLHLLVLPPLLQHTLKHSPQHRRYIKLSFEYPVHLALARAMTGKSIVLAQVCRYLEPVISQCNQDTRDQNTDLPIASRCSAAVALPLSSADWTPRHHLFKIFDEVQAGAKL